MQSQIDWHTGIAIDPMRARPVARVIKVLGSLVFYLLSESWRFCLRLAGRNPAPIVVCVYYHHVLNTERERFAAQMDSVVRWTTPLSSTAQIPSAGGHYTVVTADDGWKSFADNAVPELVKRAIPATIFVISDRLSQTVDDITADRIVSEAELHDIGRVITIGSHTATHPRMTLLSEADARGELVESRARLEQFSATPVQALCFPYGAFNQGLVTLARDCGYRQIYVGVPIQDSKQNEPIGRFRVDPSNWGLEFHLKIVGAYRWVPMLSRLKQKVLAFKRDKQHLLLGRITSV
jgi:peptidoglycan/xylan/chitin deacetylase (PgdA/CDA1 family)